MPNNATPLVFVITNMPSIWEIHEKLGNGAYRIVASGPLVESIKSQETFDASCHEGLAMTASPALLAALKSCAMTLDADLNGPGMLPEEIDQAITKAKAAIKQAEGGK